MRLIWYKDDAWYVKISDKIYCTSKWIIALRMFTKGKTRMVTKEGFERWERIHKKLAIFAIWNRKNGYI